MAKARLLWVDNDALNYFCKAGCLSTVLNNAPYRFATTAFIQIEAERGVQAGVHELQHAVTAMQRSSIIVYDIDVPPLNGLLPQPQLGLGLGDTSLALCASYYGGEVLTNDAALIRYLQKNGIGCLAFRDFLSQASVNGWLSDDVILKLKRLAMP